jgi:hypothetical protein
MKNLNMYLGSPGFITSEARPFVILPKGKHTKYPCFPVLQFLISSRPYDIQRNQTRTDTMSLTIDEVNPNPSITNGDILGELFQRPFFLSSTIGIPFCLFKLLFGITAIQIGRQYNLLLTLFGGLIVIWAIVDLMMNVARSILDLLHRPAPFEFCSIAQVGLFFHKPGVFLAIDTLLTFSIICTMLWSGWIARLTLFETSLWAAATTLNLISLSVVSLHHEIRMS